MAKPKTIVAVLARSLFPDNSAPVMWQVGQPVPMPISGPSEATQIARMFQLQGGEIEVFALPIPGTTMDAAKEGLILTISAAHVVTVLAVSHFGNGDWQNLLKEAIASEEEENIDEDDEDGDSEGEEVDEENQSTTPTLSLVPPVPANISPPPPVFVAPVSPFILSAANMPSIPESIQSFPTSSDPNQSGT